MTEYFEGKCYECDKPVIGSWDWENGNICIQGLCSCNTWNLESDCDWKKVETEKREV